MFGNQYRPPSRKAPLGKPKARRDAGGAYEAGYKAAMRDARSRVGPSKAKAKRRGLASATETFIRPSYGEDSEGFSNPRYKPRVGWRW